MKVIDGKYHIENETIVKTTNGVPIPEGDPLILFRGRDKLALPMLRKYLEICIADNCTPYQLEALAAVIAGFEAFRDLEPQVMKQPGATLGK